MKNAGRARAGRPVVLTAEERRAIILASAEALFLERGYAATSMVDIAQHAGMSKRTIYEIFADKETIFSNVVNFYESVPSLLPPTSEQSGETLLRNALVEMTGFLFGVRQVSRARLAIAEARGLPDLALAFFDATYDAVISRMTDLLDLLAERGDILVADRRMAADLLVGAMVGDKLVRFLAFPDEASDIRPEAIFRRAEVTVAMAAQGLGMKRS